MLRLHGVPADGIDRVSKPGKRGHQLLACASSELVHEVQKLALIVCMLVWVGGVSARSRASLGFVGRRLTLCGWILCIT